MHRTGAYTDDREGMADLKALAEALINGKREVVVDLVKKGAGGRCAACENSE
jgi:hypothetical protein